MIIVVLFSLGKSPFLRHHGQSLLVIVRRSAEGSLKRRQEAALRRLSQYYSWRSFPRHCHRPYRARALSSRILFTTDVGTAPSSFSFRNARISDEVSLWP